VREDHVRPRSEQTEWPTAKTRKRATHSPTSRRVGGDQIDYIDEKPEIRRIFTTELAKHGIAPRMDAAYAKEMAELGVKSW